MYFRALLAAVGAVFVMSAAPAQAATLVFQETAIANGSLGGVSFTNAVVTLSGSGNTNNIIAPVSGIYVLPNVPVAVNVSGLGTGNFVDQIGLVSNNLNSNVGLGDFSINRALLFTSNSAGAFDLSTSFGPTTGTATINAGLGFSTTAGTFVLDSAASAIFQETVSAVPEPASWAMLMLGFGMIGLAMRGRRVSDVAAS